MGLIDNFREKVSKLKTNGVSSEANFDVFYSSGFLAIDYLNGTTIFVEGKDRQFEYNATGIVDGSTNTFIGRSGSGKSTLITQIAGNIIRPFVKKSMNTALFIDDIEGSLPQSRKEFLLGLTREELEKYVVVRNFGITAENLFDRIKVIRDTKISNRKEYEYDTGMYDTYGNRIFKLVPTIYLVDSLPMLLPENLAEDDDLGGSMAASSIAKTNTMLFKKISQWCKEANIIFFTVNHILDNINMGFIPKASQLSGIAQDERLPGSKAATYLANNMFRTDDGTTLKDTEGFGINGSVVKLTLVKSRTNATKRSVPLIFNKTEGKFDTLLSLFQLLKQEGKLGGAGVKLYIDGADDIKFSQKTFKQTIESSPELQKAFSKACYDILVKFLSETKTSSSENMTASDNICDMISMMGNGASEE